MLARLIFAFAIGMSVYAPTTSHAQQIIESYVARLSEADHFNSAGQAAIIRQDRANFHRFGIKNPEDKSAAVFACAIFSRMSPDRERNCEVDQALNPVAVC
jgi:hypothetical protein